MNTKNRVPVREVMSQNFVMLDGMQTAREAIVAMKEQKTEIVIVQKRDKHDAYGIVLLADIAKNVMAKDKSLDRVNLYEIMSKPVISVPPTMDVKYCARLFERFNISCAPVIEAEEILGMSGYRELLLKVCEELD